MPKFLVEIPLLVTRETEFAVDHEPTQSRSLKFQIEADDEEDAVDFVGWLLLNELDDDDMLDVEPVLS